MAEGSLSEIEVLTSLDAMDWQPLPEEDLEANPGESRRPELPVAAVPGRGFLRRTGSLRDQT